MRLTQPQAVALAHWTPGVAAAYRPMYVGGPTLGTVRALVAHGALLLADPRPSSRLALPMGFMLTPAGCAALAHLLVTEAVVIPAGCVRLHSDTDDCGFGCWVIAQCRLRTARPYVVGPGHVMRALAWAPTAEEWAMGRAEHATTEGGAAMSRAR